MDQEKQIITFEEIFKSEKKPEKKERPSNKRSYTYTLLYYAMVMYIIASIIVIVFASLPNFTKTYTEEELVIEAVAQDYYGLATIPESLWQTVSTSEYNTQVSNVGTYEGFIVIVNAYNDIYRETFYATDEFGFEVFNVGLFEQSAKVTRTWDDGSTMVLYRGDLLPEASIFSVDDPSIQGPQTMLTADASSLLNFLIYLIMIPGIIYFMKHDILFDYKEAKAKGKDLIIPVILGYAYVWAGNLISNALSTFIASSYNLNVSESVNQRAIISAVTSSTGILMIISAVFIGPIIEELVFRKALFGLIKNNTVALLVSTVVFGLIHVVGEASLAEALVNGVAYFVMGFVFGFIYLKSDRNIIVPTIVHILNNGVSILFILILL
jgi:membrane protease YdiL (CAAX protease family)